MKKTTALLVLLCCCLAGFSQRVYFVYLQSEGSQPFFLKMNEQVYSSNSSGYLILSKLKDSTYQFSVGFPQNKWPEQAFTVPIRGKDLGFLLKNTAERNWSLVDLQTDTRIDGEVPVRSRSFKTEPRQVSAFTDVLSRAANDPSLKERVVPVEQPVVKKADKNPAATPADKETAAVSKDSAAVALIPTTQDPPKPTVQGPENRIADTAARVSMSPAVQTTLPDSSKRKEEVASLTPVTIDTISSSTITPPVQAVLPATPVLTGNVDTTNKRDSLQQTASPGNMPADTSAQLLTARPEKKEETTASIYRPSKVNRRTESSTTEGFGITFVDEYPDGKKDTIRIMIPNPKQVVRNVPPPQEEGQFLPMDSEAKDLTPVKKQPAGKDECASMASETDYLKLRKKMVATDGDDAMLAAAKKVFKAKCFTTEQIRNLGTLFLNDAGRYNFFDAAYLSTSDRASFAALESELKDAYYISRFRAMLR